MDIPTLLLGASTLSAVVWSHRSLTAKIEATKESIITVVSGRVREIGPIEAQTTALKQQAVERAHARRTRPATLNL